MTCGIKSVNGRIKGVHDERLLRGVSCRHLQLPALSNYSDIYNWGQKSAYVWEKKKEQPHSCFNDIINLHKCTKLPISPCLSHNWALNQKAKRSFSSHEMHSLATCPMVSASLDLEILGKNVKKQLRAENSPFRKGAPRIWRELLKILRAKSGFHIVVCVSEEVDTGHSGHQES